MFVDLHIHSYFSDGAQTPEQAALACRDSGVGLAAMCDHNSWLGCERFAAACEDLGVQSIRGAEFDCRWQGYHLHILGYDFTPTPQLAAIAHRSRELLLQMSVDLIEKMGLPLRPAKRRLGRAALSAGKRCDPDPERGNAPVCPLWPGLHLLPLSAGRRGHRRHPGGRRCRCAGPSGQLFFRDGTSQFIHHF